MSKKSRSYTVAFGDLEISVSTASVDTSEDVLGAPKPPGRKDEALTRALEVARKKESLKRVLKDDEYFDSLHANAIPVSATTERKTTKANIVRPAKVNSRINSTAISRAENDPVPIPWLQTIPDSVRCIVENSGSHAGKSASVGAWSDQKGSECGKSEMEDYFGGLKNIESVVSCWYCSESMPIAHYRQFPKMLPYKHQPSTSYFMVRGYYCSWECVKLHSIELGSCNVFNLLALFMNSLFQTIVQLRPLCSKYQLQKYGGKHAREEYEKMMHPCNDERITHKLDWHPNIQNCVRILDIRQKKKMRFEN